MPAGLHADWNDCLRLGKKGESTFVAFQLYYAMSVIRGYAEERKDTEYVEYINKVQAELGKSLSDCWMRTDSSVVSERTAEVVGAKHES